jgi:hypothetical protein
MGETNVHNPIKCPLDIAPYPLSSQPNSVETSPSMSSSNWRSTTPIRTELGHRCCVSGGGSSYDGAGRHGDTVRQNTEILQVGTCFGVFLVEFGFRYGLFHPGTYFNTWGTAHRKIREPNLPCLCFWCIEQRLGGPRSPSFGQQRQAHASDKVRGAHHDALGSDAAYKIFQGSALALP